MLQEKPDKLLLSSIESFEIEPDLLTLRRIEEVIAKTNQIRTSIIEDYTNKITSMKTECKNLQNEISILTKVSGINYENLKQLGEGNEESMKDVEDKSIFKIMNEKAVEMDNLKLSLAKNLNDLESQINTLHITKKSSFEEFGQLEKENENIINENIINHPDSKTIKIKIYKSLGVEIEPGDEKKREQDRVIIYDKTTNLSNILKVEDKYSDYFITNYIWDKISGL